MATSLEEFDQIVRPIERQMMLTVWNALGGDTHETEDAFQDAMMIVLKRWNYITRHANPPALILKICADCAYDHLRRKLRLSRRFQNMDKLNQPGCADDPAKQLLCCESRLEIMSAISKLSRNQAVAFLLRHIEGQEYDVIATALNCSEVTVRKHVERARNRLSILLHKLAPTRKPTYER